MTTSRDAQEILDRIDKKILYRLDLNARVSIAELAKATSLNSDTVRYRVKQLEKRNILKNCHPFVDVFKLGRQLFRTYANVRTSEGRVEELIAYLRNTKSTWWIAQSFGDWNFIFSICARDVLEFHETQQKVLHSFSDIILDSTVCTLVDVWNYPKRYLSSTDRHPGTYQGKRVPVFVLDDLDRKILGRLNKDGRQPATEIARSIQSTPSVVDYRLKRFEQSGVIVGYRTQIDFSRVGVHLFKLLVEVVRIAPEDLKVLLKFCEQNPNVTCLLRQIGPWPIELHVEVFDYAELGKVINELSDRCSAFIKSVRHILISADHLHRIPSDL